MADQTPAVPAPIVTPFYLDKALWLVVLTPLCAIVAAKLGIALNAEEIIGLVLPVVAYIVSHKWKTASLQKASIDAGAQAAAAVTDPAAALAAINGPAK